ncbi:hypothetical protein J1N35_025057 [Gossypium stocksii]|uniref:RNase H type-1 domain-containing protein n=1 Tax=Gossypium stocksii TaxID=47602 RepID=A0A9D3V5P9_9ROSI|nr:hypothetical protein J1N35_025057 [Gossypium stocksii]
MLIVSRGSGHKMTHSLLLKLSKVFTLLVFTQLRIVPSREQTRMPWFLSMLEVSSAHLILMSDNHSSIESIISTALAWTKSTEKSNTGDLLRQTKATLKHWMPSEQGWVKLNIGGVVSNNTNGTLIGGVFRDSSANWLHGFTMRIENERIFKVEARAILEGLQIAWEADYRHLGMECDNTMIVESILTRKIIFNRITKL